MMNDRDKCRIKAVESIDNTANVKQHNLTLIGISLAMVLRELTTNDHYRVIVLKLILYQNSAESTKSQINKNELKIEQKEIGALSAMTSQQLLRFNLREI